MLRRFAILSLAVTVAAAPAIGQTAWTSGQRGIQRLVIPPAGGAAPAAQAPTGGAKSPLPAPVTKTAALPAAAAAGPAAAGLASGGLAFPASLGLLAAGVAAAAVASGSASTTSTVSTR
jgi:hypothetical protein